MNPTRENTEQDDRKHKSGLAVKAIENSQKTKSRTKHVNTVETALPDPSMVESSAMDCVQFWLLHAMSEKDVGER